MKLYWNTVSRATIFWRGAWAFGVLGRAFISTVAAFEAGCLMCPELFYQILILIFNFFSLHGVGFLFFAFPVELI